MLLRGSLILVTLLAACGDASRSTAEAELAPGPVPAPVPTSALPPPAPRRCVPPPGVTGSPASIAEAVALLDALPAPVTVACFVESLDRPLEVFASASPFSAQPSMELESPRIFIRNGPLTMAVVPQGMGKRLLELGEHAGDGRTIKGEIELPHAGALAPSALYERVQVGAGTTCGVCHDDEAPAPAGRPGYASEILRPPPELDVPLAELRRQAAACDPTRDADRCELLAALFDHGEVRVGTLPAGGRICDGH